MNTCLQCGDPTENPKFCSRSCSATYNNKGVRRNGQEPQNCLYCGSKLRQYEQAYCSREHAWAHRTEQKIQQWYDGEWDGSKANGEMSRTLRAYLLEQAGYACSQCGWSEISPTLGYPPVQIDHIDGNWTNHAPNNVRVLCPNCHSLTETFGAQNKTDTPKRAVGSKTYAPIV